MAENEPPKEGSSEQSPVVINGAHGNYAFFPDKYGVLRDGEYEAARRALAVLLQVKERDEEAIDYLVRLGVIALLDVRKVKVVTVEEAYQDEERQAMQAPTEGPPAKQLPAGQSEAQ